VLSQQRAEFILERDRSVMLLLAGNIGLNPLEVRATDREDGIAALPFEDCARSGLFLGPEA
jgi:hypothetical protein